LSDIVVNIFNQYLMATKVFSCSLKGLNGQIVEVQADVSNGLSCFSIVGLGDTSVQESKERVRASIRNSSFNFPFTRKTINLAPAQIKKQGSLFDLPIAISILAETKQIPIHKLEKSILIGELGLQGELNGINGILAIVDFIKSEGFTKIFLPKENAKEASFLSGIDIYPIETLRQLALFCQNKIQIKKFPNLKNLPNHDSNSDDSSPQFASIVGHEKAKRALSIAAAGHHNILFHGSPGCGKTVLARSFRDLFTAMDESEILETTKIFSIAGLCPPSAPLISKRPVREVHHTASITSIVGGGANSPRPGEISLAHNGVLILDEIAEFPKYILEGMRQPLEDKFINITRASFSARFPCNFILIATMNPCPCGYHEDKKIPCICSKSQIDNYKKKISGPIKDRFDIFLQIEKSSFKNFLKTPSLNNYKKTKSTINAAHLMQKKRFENSPNLARNSDMELRDIQKFAPLTPAIKSFLDQAATTMQLSNRGYLRTIKLARTIADLEESAKIEQHHLAEALQYRST
jgi:magnesium chelatase family protein